MCSPAKAIVNNAVIQIPIPGHWAHVLLGTRAWLRHSLQSCVRVAVLTMLLVLKHLEPLHLPSLLHSSHRRISGVLHLKRRSHVFLHSFIRQLFTEHLLCTNKLKQTCAAVSSQLFLILLGDSHNINLAYIYWMCNIQSSPGPLVEDMQTITMQ